MSLTVFLAVLTLAPAVVAVLALALSRVQRVPPALACGVAIMGALVPAIGLLVLAPDLAYAMPIQGVLFGGHGGQPAWFAVALRADDFGFFAAFGLSYIVTPVLLWLGWRSGGAPDAADRAPTAAADSADAAGDRQSAAMPDTPSAPAQGAALAGAHSAVPRQLLNIALVLALESAGLMISLADNVLWLGLCWLILAALAWGLGELGTDPGMVDRRGLIAMLLGPLLWIGAMLLLVVPYRAPRLYDLMGRGGATTFEVTALAFALALAGGAYPFSAWVRRRAAFTTPTGFGAVVLAVVPATIFIGGRTESALADAHNLLPQLGASTPPVTAGLIIALFGALTIGINGLLALGRRDGRSLIALLACAQVGWALLAIGVGQPISMIALVTLLASSVLGLGAMVLAMAAGGMLTPDVEPDGAGPRAFGQPFRALPLAAWSVGAASLVGVPLLAGFVARQMISAGAMESARIAVPLVGVAWAGDTLLALAVLRATAPALTDTLAGRAPDLMSLPPLAEADVPQQSATDVEEGLRADDAPVAATGAPRAVAPAGRRGGEVLAGGLALLALALGMVPQLMLGWWAIPAAGTLLQAATAAETVRLAALGYRWTSGEWLPSAAWIAIALLAAVLVVLRLGTERRVRPVALAGNTAAELYAPSATAEDMPEPAVVEPEDAWREFQLAFASPWAVPGRQWLLDGVEDDLGAADADDDGTDEEVSEADADDDETEDEDEQTGTRASDVPPDAPPDAHAAGGARDAAHVAPRPARHTTGDKPGDQA